MPSVGSLKRRLAQTLKARNLEAALGALSQLAREEPREPSWPRRAARIMHATSDFEGELAALRRALELQVDRGLVLDAIATCKAILALRPGDAHTLETLDLLYLHGRPDVAPDAGGPVGDDEPLESLLLTEVVPGARDVQLGGAAPGEASEIVIDEVLEMDGDGSVPDLRLEAWKDTESPESLAAAQVMSLPTPADGAAQTRSRAAARGASLRAALVSTPLFGDLDGGSLQTLIHHSRLVTLGAGDVLFRQGDPADSLYVVVEGAVVPIAEGERRHKLAVLERGTFFGEIGLLTRQPRNATIEAIVDTRLLSIDRRLVRRLIADEPSVAKGILRFLRARMLDRLIRTHPLFAAFAHAEREAVARQLRLLEVKDGARVVEGGRPGEGLFVVLAGALDCVDPEAGKEVRRYGQGDVFGALSVLDGRPEPVHVVACGKCWLVLLGEARFRRIAEANPKLVGVVRRLAEASVTGAGPEGVSRP
jgi:CRP-like cAMP-binding protein